MKITIEQKEAAKARIFDNLASAISQSSQENWEMVVLRCGEIIDTCKQLDSAEVTN